MEDGDLEQWVKAKNSNNEVGYVPEKYLEFPSSAVTNTLNNNIPTLIVHEKPSVQHNFYPGSNYTNTGTLSSISGNSSTSGTSSLTAASIESSGNNKESEPGNHKCIILNCIFASRRMNLVYFVH